MSRLNFAGKKVKVKSSGKCMLSVWRFDEDREYEILMDRQNDLHISDNRGLALCLCITEDGDRLYAPGVESIYSIEVMK
ncbi:hypothetical protein ACQ45_gp55 [Citrobacter phage Stevie]|uniref:Uncharacterized protein n=2 Tax=Tlsvirus TaxID=1920865 RepID=A0AAE8YS22_9CAUD|nr:hypothetical protein ACQ45_gp55 [Citrobacter phage Stevie]UGO49805.1 hypothetical protein MISHU_57 [Escherichia phage vB_EcoD_Mishu]UGO53571.1 hypothetical protein DEVORATOR_55 [Citrobacter phage_vB_CfrD_Devorator]WBF80907.1 hypothetical protein DDONNNOJ_00084 [Citrobacter phage BSwS KMM3]WPK28030.1 hypothetical protein [Escherichia phage vB-Eco-KMB25]AIX12324.1 hypothetical protein CPT_Stevie55 [Citrobacter phage Stevie]